ncbi:MAG: lactate racemase domain-containing protein, partial [Planctomycetota bacterium]
ESNTVVKVPQLAWWGDIEAELSFPDHWEVTVQHMNGHETPKLSPEGFRKAFAHPIACKPIRDLARGKKNVIILFDDMSRPTKVSEIVPFVLEELEMAGVDEGNIQFICALGTHGPLTAYDFAKKLGEDIIARFNVYNHNIYENCTHIGTTSRGTPVSLNTEFVNADFKIGIGALIPHINVGFSGGGKIVLPGIASIESIAYNHGPVRNCSRETGINANTGLGQYEDNAQLLDTEEACKMSGLDVKIDAIVNLKRDTTALFVGEPIAQFYEGIKLAKKHYHGASPVTPDVVVANCNGKVNETVIGTMVAQSLLPDSGGTLVMITNNPGGEVCHYLRRRFGNHIAGRLWKAPSLSPKIKKFILLMPFMNKASLDWFAPPESITWTKKWEDVIEILETDYPEGAKAAVIPDATIQYFDVVTKSPYVGKSDLC